MIMFLYGISCFITPWKHNPFLNTIGVYFFYIGIPIIAWGIYIIRKNWRYITDKESWYK